MLDIGYAFAEPAYLAGLVALGAAELVGVDLAQADVPGLRPVVADVRKLPFRDASFDLAFCISTLEHVGRDNEVYDVDAARRGRRRRGGVARAASRAHEGRPPACERADGRDRGPGLADQCARRRTGSRSSSAAAALVYEDELYVRGADGWRSASLDEARAARYGDGGPGAGAVLLAELHPEHFGGKMRLAVRDVRHRDEIRRSTLP